MRMKIGYVDADYNALDNLRYRVDFIPEFGEAGYDEQHIQTFERAPTSEELADPKLLELVPKVWTTNPIECHFFSVGKNATLKDVEGLAAARADKLKVLLALRDEKRLLIGTEFPKR
jgi:hypothetical protein